MNRRSVVGTVLAVLVVTVGVITPAKAYDSIRWDSIDGGGVARVTAGVFTLGATIGQPDAGTLTAGAYTLRGGFWTGGMASAVGVGDDTPTVRAFRLFPTKPNPVRSISRIAFDLPRATPVRISIFDVSGRMVRRVDLGLLTAGHQEHMWGAVDDDGRPIANGTYFLRVDAGRDRGVRKVLVIR